MAKTATVKENKFFTRSIEKDKTPALTLVPGTSVEKHFSQLMQEYKELNTQKKELANTVKSIEAQQEALKNALKAYCVQFDDGHDKLRVYCASGNILRGKTTQTQWEAIVRDEFPGFYARLNEKEFPQYFLSSNSYRVNV